VQPVALVPYSSQEQPLYTFDTDLGGGGYGGYAPTADNATWDYGDQQDVATASTKTRRGGTSLLLMLFTLLAAAVLVLGNFVEAVVEYTSIVVISDVHNVGYKLVMDLVTPIISSGLDVGKLFETDLNIITVAIAGSAVLLVLTFIVSIFNIRKPGAPLLSKVTLILAFLAAAFACVYLHIKGMQVGYGAYIFAGITLFMTIIALAVRRKKKIKKA
jgi:hypothetical protein